MKPKRKSYAGVAILTAITASLCCITPVLAFIAGIGGGAAAFSWLEPLRPYLIGFTLLVLGFAWYQKLKPRKEVDCECEEYQPINKEAGISFMQSKRFLAFVTGFALLMLAFPYYAGIFYPKHQANQVEINQGNLVMTEFNITGMTCSSCEEHITHAIQELEGIYAVNASYEKGIAQVQFDRTKTFKEEIAEAINLTGYKVTD